MALEFLQKKLKLNRLVVCNLDHGIRGKESGADSSFVNKLAEESDLGFIHKKINLPSGKPKGVSTEEAAREERYKFFMEAAKACGATVLATGHTLDDQAETVLMRIIKGASLKGMVGISPVRTQGPVKVVRPLFELEKKDIEAYLDERSVAYRIDSSNLEPVYFRNIVRNEILPYLEKHNPRLKRVLSNLAEHLREDFEFISDAKKNAVRSTHNAVRNEIRLKDIAIQPKAIQKEILRDYLERSGGEIKRLSFRHWKELEHLITRKSKGSSVDLPGDIRITRTSASLVFGKRP
jgi:tRNA(Ile)-lysidine synthase